MRWTLLIAFLVLTGCQTTKDSYSFVIKGKSIDDSDLPWSYHQARYELEYAKRASEKLAVSQFLGEALVRQNPSLEHEAFHVAPPNEALLQKFHTDMKRFLPPDFAANKELIAQYYVKWQKAAIKKQYVRQELDAGRIQVIEPALKAQAFPTVLPQLPEQGDTNPKLDILVVSVLDCDVCQDRQSYMEKIFAEYRAKASVRWQVLETYPGDTGHAHYKLARGLICASHTPAYWSIRSAVFAKPDAVPIEDLLAESARSDFHACMQSNEPERILARNNELANELYARNLYSIYINRVKIAFPTPEIVRAKLDELLK